MKRILLSLALGATMCLSTATKAQIVTPAPSPTGKIEQKIGLTDVTLEYARPSAKGRKVFGPDAIVPFGEPWRTGANAATKVTFSDDVTIENKSLKKGSYALITKPGATSWEVHFHVYETGDWGSYIAKTPALAASVTPMNSALAFETFTINFSDFSGEKATMYLMWGNTIVPIKIGVEVDKKVMANIEKVMGGPTAADYYNAGSYYHDAGKDLNQALAWVQKATKVDSPRFWQLRREALILGDLGRFAEAIEVAKKSIEGAKAAGNMEYVNMNEKSIAEWSKKK